MNLLVKLVTVFVLTAILIIAIVIHFKMEDSLEDEKFTGIVPGNLLIPYSLDVSILNLNYKKKMNVPKYIISKQ
jgi:hypothetical protein